MDYKSLATEKLKEAAFSVLPISAIVFVLCLFFVPISSGIVLSFIVGTIMIILGMAAFTIGVDTSMSEIGNHIGSKITASRKLWLLLAVSFILGIIITIAEPDLQVLATYVPDIDTAVLVATVAVGVGIFLLVSMLRILFVIPLKWILLVLYAGVFILAFSSDINFLSVAFDSGGVTTGPMTVPFIMALGVGVASVRSDEKAKDDSFGLIALCSIGPILAVLILGFIYRQNSAVSAAIIVREFETSIHIGREYLKEIPSYLWEVAVALLPIFAFFLIFQIFSLKLNKHALHSIMVGIVFTYFGLVLFLTGANVGFSALGYMLGHSMVQNNLKWLIVPLAMVMGWFIISAEPAVHVLNKQVEELSAGAISEKAMGIMLSIAVAFAMGLAMLRVLTGFPILWFMIAGYAVALILAFFVKPTFTAIAFDAGGVASGPITAAFMLPFAIGICSAGGGSIMTDAFGLVAMVAMMPLITVQVMGAISAHKEKSFVPEPIMRDFATEFADDEVIELWEVA